jgi:site-specific recombinase XerD
MPWAVEALEEYLAEVRPCYAPGNRHVLWLTERGGRISLRHLNDRFVAYRDALGLPAELTPHCLRHSYVSHLVEDGVDPLFVQQQVGHSHPATTAIYTSVSTDYRNRVMRKALDRAFTDSPKEDQQ